MTAATRQRRRRARIAAGEIVLRNIVIKRSAVDVLTDAGRLPEWDSEDADAIARAVERLLDDIESRLILDD